MVGLLVGLGLVVGLFEVGNWVGDWCFFVVCGGLVCVWWFVLFWVGCVGWFVLDLFGFRVDGWFCVGVVLL